MLFKNRTQYSIETYQKFLEFHQEKYGYKYTFFVMMVILTLIVFIILQLKSKSIYAMIFTILILIGFIYYTFQHPKKIIDKESKSSKIEKKQEFVFNFYEKYFIIYSKKTNNRIKYKKIYKAYETEEFFYLYINKTHSILLDKNGFEIGTPKEFSKFIDKKCRFKYVKG